MWGQAVVASQRFCGLDRIPYSISFIEDPDLNYDGLLDVRSKRGDGDEHIADAVDTADTDDTAAVDADTINTVGTVDLGNNRTATIYLNLSKLTPFSTDVIPSGSLSTPEEKDLDENYRHLMKICTVVYHEMRHLYQRRAVELYMINQFTGGGSGSWKARRNVNCGNQNWNVTFSEKVVLTRQATMLQTLSLMQMTSPITFQTDTQST